jgi:hypothetical protein
MSVLVNYHMDTFFGIGYRSEHIHGGYPCTGGYVQLRREMEETLSGVNSYMVKSICRWRRIQSSMILDE